MNAQIGTHVFMMLPDLPHTQAGLDHSQRRHVTDYARENCNSRYVFRGFQNTLTIPPWGAVVSLG